MKYLALIAALTLPALPAAAQNWTSYQSGNHRSYNGTDQNGGMWSGSSYQSGDQTHSTFYGPQGQMHSCSSYQSGNRTNTTCY